MSDRDLHLLMDACRILKNARLHNGEATDEAIRIGDALSQLIVEYVNEPVEVPVPF